MTGMQFYLLMTRSRKMHSKDDFKASNISDDTVQDLGNTQFFTVEAYKEVTVKNTLAMVYEALTEKGYNPVNQIVGYIMSGDPTYITSHKGARSLIMKVERDELVEELLTEYIRKLV
jgi:uncharacterized protein (UPF0297 family)